MNEEKKLHRLKGLRLEEISLVPVGADEGALITFFKSKNSGAEMKVAISKGDADAAFDRAHARYADMHAIAKSECLTAFLVSEEGSRLYDQCVRAAQGSASDIAKAMRDPEEAMAVLAKSIRLQTESYEAAVSRALQTPEGRAIYKRMDALQRNAESGGQFLELAKRFEAKVGSDVAKSGGTRDDARERLARSDYTGFAAAEMMRPLL